MVNIPFIFAWSALGFADSLSTIYGAFIVMGFGLGLKEAASLTYATEICETSIRGMLLASAGLFGSFGLFALFVLGAFLSWRKVALMCVFVPICILFTTLFVSLHNNANFHIEMLNSCFCRCRKRRFGCYQRKRTPKP